MAFFEFILSPCGSIGRAKWWLGQLLLAPAMVAVVIYLLFIFASAAGFDDPLKLLAYIKAHNNPAYPVDPHLVARIRANLPSVGNLVVVDGLLLVLCWSALAIQIKRWHDLGMSGFWVLIGIVPGAAQLFLPHLAAAIVSIIFGLGQLIFLGFLPGVYIATPARYSPHRPQPAPRSFGGYASMLVVSVVLVLVFGYMWSAGQLPASVTQYLPASLSSSTSQLAASVRNYLPTSLPWQTVHGTDSSGSANANGTITHRILDCSFEIPATWQIQTETNEKFQASNGNKIFEATTHTGENVSRLDPDSAAFTNVLMLYFPQLYNKVIADTRDPFRGHPAYNLLGHISAGNDAGSLFILGRTLYSVEVIEPNVNPLNDPELGAIMDSITLTEPPTH
jgi:uncharacterized membrane protein YhaH (DUF805 family)